MKRRGGFTLIEVLVAVVLVTVGIVSTMNGIAAIEAGNAKAHTADLLQRLAQEKLNDAAILQTPTANGASGDFQDRGYPTITWTLEDDSTNVTGLDQVTAITTEGKESQTITTLMYVAANAGTSSTTSSTSSAGTAVP
jgi:prepilin-type N-terminal cleavage/methylation domain-containing protein